MVATSLLSRLLHHAIVIQIEGASYRLCQHAILILEAMRPKAPTAPTGVLPSRRGHPPKHRHPQPQT